MKLFTLVRSHPSSIIQILLLIFQRMDGLVILSALINIFLILFLEQLRKEKNIIRSTNNGISAYIDSDGIVLNKLESTQKGVIEINNYKKLDKTFFSKFGNKIFFYFTLIYISLIFFIYNKER